MSNLNMSLSAKEPTISGSFIISGSFAERDLQFSTFDAVLVSAFNMQYIVAKTHRMPYVAAHFPQKRH